jgi:branched-chain amino acid aminotransferase
LKKLVSIEKDWIPKSTAASLYIRPTFIGTEPTLGVSATNSAKLYVITSPTGPYFPTGFKPVTLLADNKYIRAFPGGVGNFKVGSNYGPTIFVGIEAQKKGCQQVLWLFGDEEYLTEAGTMNMFVVIKNDQGETELVTPPLDGTILEGVTRQSILDLARKWVIFKFLKL